MNIEKPTTLVKESVTVSLIFSDIIAMCLSFMLALVTAEFLKDIIQPDVYNKPLADYKNIHDLFFVWMSPIILFMFFTKGHYTQRVPWWSQAQHVIYICFIALIMDGFFRFALGMSFSRLLIGLSWVYVLCFTLIGRQMIYIASRGKGIWRIPTIIISDIETVTDALFAFNADHYTGYDVKKIYLRDTKNIDFDINSVPSKYKNIDVIRDKTDYKACINKNPDHFFVVSLETFRGQEKDDIINALTQSNALYAIIPPISRMSLFEMEPRYFFGYDVMLMHARNSMFSPFGRFIKRSMDIIITLLALLALTLPMIIISILIKIEGQGGSIFYGGYRIGRNGKKFKCWKFRSMQPDSDHLLEELLERDPKAKSDWEKFRKLKQPDPRITTKTARFIRKASIDELPQLWNVLKGDMSLVGPRPILEDEIELFGDAINQYIKTKPGITGLWQVSGRSNASFQRRVNWDSWYVRNWSVWGDIVILIKTLRVVLGGSGAY